MAGPEANPAHSGREVNFAGEAPGRLWGASMEQTACRYAMSATKARVRATLAVALAAQKQMRRFTGMGRHKGVPYIRPTAPKRTSALFLARPRPGPGVETRMEQTPERAARSNERGRAAAVIPCEVGVAGPEADPAHSGREVNFVGEAPGRLWGASIRQRAP